MRKINKNPEPKEWTSYRLTPGADYKAIPELRRALLEEQGYICAYCMRRIPVKDSNSNETSRIEHILCRGKHDDEKLHYTKGVITFRCRIFKKIIRNDLIMNFICLFKDNLITLQH